ncbi:unnamed protein product [Effrenium voratum]|nr:unnamed protein product [Effrenium voratum]
MPFLVASLNGIRRAYAVPDAIFEEMNNGNVPVDLEEWMVRDAGEIAEMLCEARKKDELKTLAIQMDIRVKSKDAKPVIALAIANKLCENLPEDAAISWEEHTQRVKDAIDDLSMFDKMLLVKWCVAIVEKQTQYFETLTATITNEGSVALSLVIEMIENEHEEQMDKNSRTVLSYVKTKADEEYETTGFPDMEDIHLHSEGEQNKRTCKVSLDDKAVINVFFDQRATGKDLYDSIYRLTGLDREDYTLNFGTNEGASVLQDYDGLYAYLPDHQVLTMQFRVRGGGVGAKTTKKPAMLKSLREKVVSKSSLVPSVDDAYMKNIEVYVSKTLQNFETNSDASTKHGEFKNLLASVETSALTEMLIKIGANNNKDTKVSGVSQLLFGEKTASLRAVVSNYQKALASVESAGVFVLCNTFLSESGKFEFSKLKEDINNELGKRQIRNEVRAEMGRMID